MKRTSTASRLVCVGIEAGGTRTTVCTQELASPKAAYLKHGEYGPANLRLLTDVQLRRHFRGIARDLSRRQLKPATIAVGMAGARTATDRARIRLAAAQVWPETPCYATNDLETALAAADGVDQHPRVRGWRPRRSANSRSLNGLEAAWIGPIPKVLVLCGTGSCCYGRSADGKEAKVGGWGHILGDKGSAYEIGLRALKAVVYYRDRDGEWSELGQRLLRMLMLNEPDDLIGWVQTAGKDEVARLALEVFHRWDRRDPIARDILTGAAHSLAKDAAACARNLAPQGGLVQFIFAGGVLLKQPRFARLVRRRLEESWPEAIVTPLRRSGVEGAVALARRCLPPSPSGPAPSGRPNSADAAVLAKGLANPASGPAPDAVAALNVVSRSTTEQRHPRSTHLDRMPTGAIIELMLSEDRTIPRALLEERAAIERAIGHIVRSFRAGGRLFYVGAGTSGRLGVLDASECPPTFRTDPELVQGIMAGGPTALWSAVEGAEDDSAAGARAIAYRGITGRDTVVGIAASGRTPFVWGALAEARERGARTVLLCFNPHLRIPTRQRPTVVITPDIGPEILTGSTRLKSGTATKLVLNMFTTIAMVRMGKVLGNLMIDVKASNVKLRDRAVRIVQELTKTDPAAARVALERHGWRIKEACASLSQAVAVSKPARA